MLRGEPESSCCQRGSWWRWARRRRSSPRRIWRVISASRPGCAGSRNSVACWYCRARRCRSEEPRDSHKALPAGLRRLAELQSRSVLIFGRACWRHGIEHRLTKPNHLWANAQAERVNRTVKEATVQRLHYDSPDRLCGHLGREYATSLTSVPERDGPFVQSDWLGKEV